MTSGVNKPALEPGCQMAAVNFLLVGCICWKRLEVARCRELHPQSFGNGSFREVEAESASAVSAMPLTAPCAVCLH